MDSLLKADIFFVVATVAVFMIAGILVWVMVYVIKIVRNVEDISETVKQETRKVSRDIDGIRERVSNHRALPRFLMPWIGRSNETKQKRRYTSDKNNS